MHPSALNNGKLFFDTYSPPLLESEGSIRVVEIGSQDVNGSIRQFCPQEFEYIGVDFVDGKGVDVVIISPYELPFDDNSVDIVVSSSCFEHSEMFWIVYLEIIRILKPHGLFYLNVPSNGMFHRYPVDCWRFYPDSGQALVTWAEHNNFNVGLLESYTSQQIGGEIENWWNDFVAVYVKNKDYKTKYPKRILYTDIKYTNGILDNLPVGELLNLQDHNEDQRVRMMQLMQAKEDAHLILQLKMQQKQLILEKDDEHKNLKHQVSNAEQKNAQTEHQVLEKEQVIAAKEHQLHVQSEQHHNYKKLLTIRLIKPLIKTEQAISSANTLRKGFRRLVKEKGSIGKAYQFLRRLRKANSMKAVKKYLKTTVFEQNQSSSELHGTSLSNGSGFYNSFFSQTKKSLQYVSRQDEFEPIKSDIKLIAFYLPQFHPIPQNDHAWGKGFTEWTNVSKAVPQYEGHHQPKLPDELGFYDLRLIDVQKRQIELAKLYGIYGFCYHHYWFDGKRVMDGPIEQILAHPELDFPFCINWANENWTKKWDGCDSEVLLAQKHSATDDIAFIQDAARYMRDPRYIRVDGKPVLMLYRPSLLADSKATGERWRTWCRENGLGELYLVITHSFEDINPESIGFDAAVEFAPNSFPLTNVTNEMRPYFFNGHFDGVLYDYKSAIDFSESYRIPNYTKFRGVCPRWDNEARKPGKGTILVGSTPVEYGRWLQSVCRFTKNNLTPSKQFVFINAWNEWAEGAYLEPDRKYGYAYLEATRNALLMADLSTSQKIAIVVHAFYDDVFEEVAKYVANISQPIKLFVTTIEHKEVSIKKIASKFGLDVDVIIVKNKGRDMLPFLKVLPIIKAAGYPFILKIHTKKSKHRTDGEIWRNDLYDKLLRPERFEKALSVLSTDLSIGIIGPEGHIVDMNTYWGSNERTVLNLVEKMNVAKEKVLGVPFVAGSMFYARMDALECLLTLNLTDDDFEEENGQIDGTLAHAIERLIGVSAICNQQIVVSIDGNTNYVKNYGFVK